MSSRVLKNIEEDSVSNENVETSEISLKNNKEKLSENFTDKNDYNELEELRRLIVQADEVGEVLPTALERRSKKDNKLNEATLPLVEENIRQSAIRNPKILAEALFPVIGPAIRKAISEALSSMVQNFNQTLEYSISPKSLRWRLEAYQTGKSFGEIVMLNTLLYRVEQVFLIHKDTGLLLQHVSANPNDTEDADMVSAMLTAITDFVHDSFKTSDDATLDSLKINELSVWIESSPDAVIAAVIRGNPPLTLRETFDEAIEKIQFQQESELNNFEGDSQIFDKSRPILEDCIRFQTSKAEEEKKSFFKPSFVVASVLALLILISGFFYIRDYIRWFNYVENLRTEKGIVLTEAERGWFMHSVSGLRDPLAVDPAEILEQHNYDLGDIEQNWKPYQDISSEFVLKRAEKYLRPPKDVRLTLENQTLIAEGNVPQNWSNEARRIVPVLFGVNEFKVVGDEPLGVIDRIESQALLFECFTTNIMDGQRQKLDSLAEDIEKFIDENKNKQIEIQGLANNTGTDEINLATSKKRAEVIMNELKKRSDKIKDLQQTNSGFIKVVAVGGKRQNDECKVTFKIRPQ